MSNSYNRSVVTVNPLLSTFPANEINIQPYWIVILELIVLQFCQRIWHHFTYNTWFTTLEIAGLIKIFQKNPTDLNSTNQPASLPTDETINNSPSNTSNSNVDITADRYRLTKLLNMIAIDYFDAVNCLLILGHAIWYCVIQSTCIVSSSSVATPWNCYNAFGYRLFNYVFVSYCTTALNCVYKTYIQGYKEVIKTDAERGSFRWLIHYASLIIIMVGLVFVTCLILPFFLTNVLPMFVIYIWMSVIYLGTSSYLIFSGFTAYDDIEELRQAKQLPNDKPPDNENCCSFLFSLEEMPKVALSMLLAFLITTFPILLSIFFNYTQYFYYGDGYLKSIDDDYNSRDTSQYFSLLQNSSKQILHSVLNFV